MGFYAVLENQGTFHLLCQDPTQILSERLARYFTGSSDKMQEVAEAFLMSPSTLSRKLKTENTSFFHRLTNVRMLHSLSLLQEGQSVQIKTA